MSLHTDKNKDNAIKRVTTVGKPLMQRNSYYSKIGFSQVVKN